MKATRLYICEGQCQYTGKIRDFFWASGFGDAKTRFYLKHKVQALHVTLER